MNYKKITTYDYNEIISVLSSFSGEYTKFVEKCRDVENKHSEIQDLFYIMHPNITPYIMDNKFNKKDNILEIQNSTSFYSKSFSIRCELNLDSRGTVDSNSVAILDNMSDYAAYMSEPFLSKEKNSYDVYWVYSIDDVDFLGAFPDYDDSNIPSFIVTGDFYLKKRNEFFQNGIYASNFNNEQYDAVTKKTCIEFFNNRTDDTIIFNSINIIASSFSINDVFTYTFSGNPILSSRAISLSNSYKFEENSIFGDKYAKDNFAYMDLSNVNKLIVPEENLADRDDIDIVSATNISEVNSGLYDKNTVSVEDSFKVLFAGNSDVISFHVLIQELTKMLNNLYVERLKVFLGGYTDIGVISELIKYIEEKILELKNKYVPNTECDIPLKAKREKSCIIACDNIFLNKEHLMVTKQKMLSLVRCSMKCELMPFSEEELIPARIEYEKKSEQNIPTPNI